MYGTPKKSKRKPTIMQWDLGNSTPVDAQLNPGKAITDNNPLIEIPNISAFDYRVNVEPFSIDLYGQELDDAGMVKMSQVLGGICKIKPVKDVLQKVVRKAMEAEAKKSNIDPMPIDLDAAISCGQAEIKMHKEETKKVIPKVSATKETNINKLKQNIIDKAHKLGFKATFTKVDRRYIGDDRNDAIPYDTVIILAKEMPKDQIMEIPKAGDKTGKIFSLEGYAEGGKAVHILAEFIREMGYECMARTPLSGLLKTSIHAVNSGMGNFTTNNLVCIPEYGTKHRLSAININANIPIDEAKEFNVEEFCSRCRMCQKACLGEAIPRDKMMWDGRYMRKLNDKACWATMKANRTCGVCLKVCPYNNFSYEEMMDTIPQYNRYHNMDSVIDKSIYRNK